MSLSSSKKIAFLFYGLVILAFFYLYQPMADGYFRTFTADVEFLKQDHNATHSSSNMILYRTGTLKYIFNIDEHDCGFARIAIAKGAKDHIVNELVLRCGEKRQLKLDAARGDNIYVNVDRENLTRGIKIQSRLRLRDRFFSYEKAAMVLVWFGVLLFLTALGYEYLFGIVFALFALSLYAENINFGTIPFSTVWLYTLWLIGFVSGYIYIREHVPSKKISFVLNMIFAVGLALVPLSVIVYINTYKTVLTKSAMAAFFQSNIGEMLDFMQDHIDAPWYLVIALVLVLMIYFHYKQCRKECIRVEHGLFVLLIAVMGFSSMFIFKNTLYGDIIRNKTFYENEVTKFKNIQSRREKLTPEDVKKAEKGETYILVIGESQSRHHMHIYGYYRETTPRLETYRNDPGFVLLRNVYSHQAYTTAVLSKSLTEANNYNHKDYFDAYSIIDIAKAAGFETYWLTNQVLRGSWDNVISVIANKSDTLIGLNHHIGRDVSTEHYDGDLLPLLQKILEKKSTKNRLIVMHLMGNHNHYSDRYPESFDKYRHNLSPQIFGAIAQDDKATPHVNTYDNSILYNDSVAGGIIDLLRRKVTLGGLIYMSDHSEEPDLGMGHSPDRFKYTMIDIPMYFYFTSSYRQRYGLGGKLSKIQERLFSNEFLYDTLLGMMHIQTKHMQERYNLLSDRYDFNDTNAVILDGKRKLKEKENHYYLQAKAIDYFQNKHQPLGVDNVTSLAMLSTMLYHGIKRFLFKAVLTPDDQIALRINALSKPVLLDTLLKQFPDINEIMLDISEILNTSPEAFYSAMVAHTRNKKIKFLLPVTEIAGNGKWENLYEHIIVSINRKSLHDNIMQMNTKVLKEYAQKDIDILKRNKISSVYLDKSMAGYAKNYLSGHNLTYYIDTDIPLSSEKVTNDGLGMVPAKSILIVHGYSLYQAKN